MQVALSTMWGLGRFKTLSEFFRAGQALGFTRFELNHGVDSAMLDGLNLGGYQIASVHAPCPADISVSTLKERDWLVSSLDEENRRQGVAAVRRSIDLAHRVGAKAVIIHPGRIDNHPALESPLREMYKAGQSGTPEYDRAKEEIIKARAGHAEKHLRAVRSSLIELAEHAAPLKVQLGLENRYYYREIPLPDELEMLLNLGYENVIGFWYDVGHAHTLEQLGFIAHEEWLKRFAAQIVGTHLHDVRGIEDHQAVGLGDVDWDMVAKYLPRNGILRTCEFQNHNTAVQVAEGIKLLVDLALSEA